MNTVIEQFEKLGVTGLVEGIEQQKVLCGVCSKNRKKSTEPCLSVNLSLGVAHCKNCGHVMSVAGGSNLKEQYAQKKYTIPDYNEEQWKLSPEALEYLQSRGLSSETLEANSIGSNTGKMRSSDDEAVPIISFPYYKDVIVNVKYRSLDKRFQLVRGAEICLYGIQNLFENGHLATKKIFITEGEIDALSLYECGFRYALSVPNGAGVEEDGHKRITPKLEYLEDPDIIQILQSVDEVVLVTDNDYKGVRLKEELAQRIGVEKCFSVTYPAGCKDINDVLVQHGKDKVIEVMLSYSPMMQGLVTVHDMEDKLLSYYSEGTEGGMTCGIDSLDDIFTTQHSQLIIVTGSPESFKSVFMDNLTKGLAENYGVHSCLYSPESRPLEMHIARIASIHNGLRLGLPEEEDRMPYMEYKASCEWVGKYYSFTQPPNNTLDEILQLWKISLTQHGTKVFVLDPYSKVNWEGENEHQFIRKMLNSLGEFACRNRVTVFVVAHPRKMELQHAKRGSNAMQDYKIVQPYDIAGSSSFYNSADIILSLWKSRFGDNPPLHVYVQKSKLHHIAKSGKHCVLDYNFDNWRLGESLYENIQIQQDFT